MAEKQCPDCKMMIDSGAKVCPHCRKKFGTSLCTKIAAIPVILFLIGFLASMMGGPSTTPPPKKQPTAQELAERARTARIDAARFACKHALLAALHDPDSAKLASTYDWGVRENKDGTILIQPSGRAKNAFGAYIKGVWNCTAKVRGKTATVISFQQVQP